MSARFCHACGTAVSPTAGFCTHCGATLAPAAGAADAAPAPAAAPLAAPAPTPGYGPGTAPPPTYGAPAKPRVTQGIAIAALLLNILVIPGVGSLVGGRTSAGGWQLGLSIGGFLLIFTIIGIILAIPMLIGAWIWGLVTGIQLVQESNAPA